MIESSLKDVIEIAANEGNKGIHHWIKGLGNLSSDLSSTQALYWAVKDMLPGAAFELAYHLRFKGILIPAIQADLDSERKRNPGIWVLGFAHILSPHILLRSQEAFEKGDVLCGLQRHYYAGAGPTPVVFDSFTGFRNHLELTRAGDEFMLVSLQQRASQNGLLPPSADSVREWLSRNSSEEVFLINTSVSPSTLKPIWKGREEDEDVDGLFQSKHGLIAVPFIWEQDFFIDLKGPNEKGEVPIGGAY